MKKLLQEKFPNMSRLQDISELLEALVTVDLAQGQVTVQTVLAVGCVPQIIREEGYGVA